MGHATEKVDQQTKIISWEKGFMGQVYKAGTKEAVQLILNKLSLFMVKMDNGEAEVVTYRITANPGVTSVDKKTVRKLDGFLSFFHSRVPEEKSPLWDTGSCNGLVIYWFFG